MIKSSTWILLVYYFEEVMLILLVSQFMNNCVKELQYRTLRTFP